MSYNLFSISYNNIILQTKHLTFRLYVQIKIHNKIYDIIKKKEITMDKENTLYLYLKDGKVTIEMFPEKAPNHVARIKELVRHNFYDGLFFHRVIEGFMAQTGDPNGNAAFTGKNPFAKDSLNRTEQYELIQKNPELARRLASDAGVSLD